MYTVELQGVTQSPVWESQDSDNFKIHDDNDDDDDDDDDDDHCIYVAWVLLDAGPIGRAV